MMREKCGGDIVKLTPMRFATNYIVLKSLHDKKDGLRHMFTSEDWFNYKHSRSNEARLVADIIDDSKFWKTVIQTLTILEPIYKYLRLMDTLYLNLVYQYEGDGLGTRVDLLKAMTDVVQQLMPFTDGHVQAQILAELRTFYDAQESLGTAAAIARRKITNAGDEEVNPMYKWVRESIFEVYRVMDTAEGGPNPYIVDEMGVESMILERAPAAQTMNTIQFCLRKRHSEADVDLDLTQEPDETVSEDNDDDDDNGDNGDGTG
ncbi:hypothetical protein GIB67_011356 [Kingdonia uniflora]|uniref:Uncharacterized protein n=1 Tax=Kingdonia uniflora TaxID=39325 RepID=A0A7J7LCI0_9MAGN|nr:hypothetical protein GIB67_011356 [Kingdonia uniflora]